MTEKNKETKLYMKLWLVFGLPISFLLGFFVMVLMNPMCFSEDKVIEEKALLDVQLYDWAINIDNPDEMFFEYWIYNYGNVEAKNVKVRCDLWDEDGIVLMDTVVENYGNLASVSHEFGTIITKNVANSYDYYIAQCHIESCDHCEILYKRIPALIETYQ